MTSSESVALAKALFPSPAGDGVGDAEYLPPNHEVDDPPRPSSTLSSGPSVRSDRRLLML